jgi:hypothetical protein
MSTQPLEAWANEIAERHGLRRREELRRTTHDLSDRLRNLIWDVEYEERPAVLKVYDDDVVNVEAESLRAFHESNRSELLTAPELYLFDVVSLTRGWLLIEKLPDEGRFLESPLDAGERPRFVELFCEYRRNFPRRPNRPLALAEAQDAYRFFSYRAMQALETASSREQQRAFDGDRTVLEHDELLPRLEAAMDRVRAVFKGRELHWGHGHFKPSDVFAYGDGRFALTDFGHTKMLPDGFEEAIVIWWDQMVVGAPQSYDEWRSAIDDWAEQFLAAEPELDPRQLWAGVLDRALSNVLETIALDDEMDAEERRHLLGLHYRLIDDLGA